MQPETPDQDEPFIATFLLVRQMSTCLEPVIGLVGFWSGVVDS